MMSAVKERWKDVEWKKITCPHCKKSYKFYGKSNRVECRYCGKWFQQKYQDDMVIPNKPVNDDIKDDILQGNILDALEKADINPANHRELFRDAIPLILKKDDLKYAFAKACQDRKRSPEEMMRKAVRYWLKEKGYL